MAAKCELLTDRAARLRDRYAPPRPAHGLDGLAAIVLDVDTRAFRIRAAARAIIAARRCREALAAQGRPISGGPAWWLNRAAWNRRQVTQPIDDAKEREAA